MQNSRLPSDDITEMLDLSRNTPPPPLAAVIPIAQAIPPAPVPQAVQMAPVVQMAQPASPTPFPPPPMHQQAYPPRAMYPPVARQHPSVTVQMSPRNLIIGGSVLAFLIVVIAAISLLSGSSNRPTPNIYSNGSFPGGNPAGVNPDAANTGDATTTTDANGNTVTMGPGAHAVQNADGSTTTTDSNGNTVTQSGGGNPNSNSGNPNSNGGFPAQQQSPFQGDSSFPQQQQQQQGGFPQQQGGFPQQQQGYPQQQQQGGYNPQQGYPQQP